MAPHALLALVVFLAALGSSSAAVYTSVKFIAVLSGQYETAAIKDSTGNGVSIIEMYRKNGVLYKARWSVTIQSLADGATPKGSGASGVVAMHIHNGTFGTSGPVIFNYGPQFIRMTSIGQALYGFSQTNSTLLKPLDAVSKNPNSYYVNVHTLPNYAAGAVRGQLIPYTDIDPYRVAPVP